MSDPYDLLLGYRDLVTEDDIRYFAEDPRRLDLIDARETGGYRKLAGFLVLAMVFIILSKVLVARYDNAVDQILNGVIVDFFFEIGSALIGAMTAVVFIGGRSVRQFRQNLELRREIEKRIEAFRSSDAKTAR